MINDRKGRLGDQVAISTFLFLMFIIGGSIAIGAFIFYGDEYDFRSLEAGILTYNVRECIIDKRIDFIGEIDADKFYSNCGLNKEVVEGNNIIQININGKDVFSANKGKVESCRLEGAKKNVNYPRCDIKVFDLEGKKYEIITGSFQKSRRLND
ncbi:hypothetical protein HYW75_04490 [Candidatus Pacearchaeota archaeon]|nr:hypothetical protein [Candidatus Pacearchaeota archaeon]